MFDFTCLYFLVCFSKGIDTQEFMDQCKSFEHDPNLYTLYVHGWLLPILGQLEIQKKLAQGTKVITIMG